MLIINIKYNKIIAFIILLLFLWVNYNIYFNSHYHIGENGQIILHAHPVQKTSQNSSEHHHTRNEFILLHILYVTFSFVLLFIILFFFILEREKVLSSKSCHLYLPFTKDGLSIRAPPFLFTKISISCP